MAEPDQPVVRAVPLFETLRVPMLGGVGPAQILRFVAERKKYLLAVESRNAEPGVAIVPASLRTSISEDRIHSLIDLELIPAQTPDEVTEAMLQQFLDEFGRRDPDLLDSTSVWRVIRDVRMTSGDAASELEAAGRVRDFADRYLTALRREGLGSFHKEFPEAAIGHILRKLEPPELRELMRRECELDKKLKKESFSRFIKEAARRVSHVEAVLPPRARRAPDPPATRPPATSSSPGATGRRSRGRKRPREDDAAERPSSSSSSRRDPNTGQSRAKRTPPLCLNKACGGRHWVRDCPVTTEDKARELIEEYKRLRSTKTRTTKRSR